MISMKSRMNNSPNDGLPNLGESYIGKTPTIKYYMYKVLIL